MSNHVSDMEELFFRALFWIADDHIAILKINWHFGEENDIMTISNGAVLSAVFCLR